MSQPELPVRARVVVIGGGIIGCSVAYHLASIAPPYDPKNARIKR